MLTLGPLKSQTRVIPLWPAERGLRPTAPFMDHLPPSSHGFLLPTANGRGHALHLETWRPMPSALCVKGEGGRWSRKRPVLGPALGGATAHPWKDELLLKPSPGRADPPEVTLWNPPISFCHMHLSGFISISNLSQNFQK